MLATITFQRIYFHSHSESDGEWVAEQNRAPGKQGRHCRITS